jgi:type III pantothenate kinase
MTLALVADVGNSRIKWGICRAGRVAATVSLPPDAPSAWAEQATAWDLGPGYACAVAGVHPLRRDGLAAWFRQQGFVVEVLDSWQRLPVQVGLPAPERVGIDRLLNAVAAKSRGPAGVPAILIDAGSAVTVDWLDGEAVFRGGAIFPGFRLMAHALHEYTALLPLVEVRTPNPPVPGTSTPAAMEAGILAAVVGGVRYLVDRLAAQSSLESAVYLTGGDAPLLAGVLGPAIHFWPEMTLEGIRLAVEGLP